MSPLLEAIVYGLAARWPVLLLATLPFLLTSAVTTVFFVVHRAVAGRDPHELALTTGEWVAQALDKQGLTGVRVGPTPVGSAGVDAFWPSARYIALKPSTLQRKDPVFWAIGAHELGHALHARRPWVGALFTGARGLALATDQALAGTLVALVVVGGAAIQGLALGLLVGSLLVQAVVLVDEVLASRTALRLLSEDGRLTTGQLGRAFASLVAALGAYLASAAARSLTLVLWPMVVSRTSTAFLPDAGDVPWPALIFLGALTLILGKRALRVGSRAWRPPRVERLSELGPRVMKENAGDLGGGLGAMLLVLAALATPITAWRDLGLALALGPALLPITSVLAAFVTMPLMVVLQEVDRVSRQADLLEAGVIPDDHVPPSRAAGPPVLTLEMHNDRSWVRRLLELMRVAYVPLLVVFWYSQAMRLM